MTVIPYAADVRPDTGLTNAKLGIWLFLASEVMLFGAVFSAYAILRSGAESWPDQSAMLNVPLALVNTLLLVSLSAAVRWARRALQAGAWGRHRLYLATTLLCATAFLAAKGVEYGGEVAQGLVPATNNFLALYYTMTGLHAAHVLGGLVVTLCLWATGVRLWRNEPVRYASRLEVTGLYWHFVDSVWILLVIVVYLS